MSLLPLFLLNVFFLPQNFQISNASLLLTLQTFCLHHSLGHQNPQKLFLSSSSLPLKNFYKIYSRIQPFSAGSDSKTCESLQLYYRFEEQSFHFEQMGGSGNWIKSLITNKKAITDDQVISKISLLHLLINLCFLFLQNRTDSNCVYFFC